MELGEAAYEIMKVIATRTKLMQLYLPVVAAEDAWKPVQLDTELHDAVEREERSQRGGGLASDRRRGGGAPPGAAAWREDGRRVGASAQTQKGGGGRRRAPGKCQ